MEQATILSACYARTYRIFTFIREHAKAQAASAHDGLLATLHATSLAYRRDVAVETSDVLRLGLSPR